ncbi:MAG: hypothetical protein HYS40_08400 [Gemmatimonadetes bacterium]|nr:hypothetical protein [Gemmatimonadota bacterium]
MKATVLSLSLLAALGVADALPPLDPRYLPVARVSADPRKGELVIELAPVDLPAGTGHHVAGQPPVASGELPVDGAIYGLRAEVVDESGRVLPPELVHHFNLIDPDHRELFLPIARRMAAAGRETGEPKVPWLLFGFPFHRGARVIASAMLHNPTPTAYRGVRTRLVLNYTPASRPWPIWEAYPWQLDVAFPVGNKSFDLPPGRSERSYEGSPAVPGKIVAIAGHLHDYGVRVELTDVTTGEVIWRAQPVRDSARRLVAIPIGRLYAWNRLGAHIVPVHRYRVTALYDNPTGRVIQAGGMGVVGGLFVPDRGAQWPAADVRDSLYLADLRHAMRLAGNGGAVEHAHH